MKVVLRSDDSPPTVEDRGDGDHHSNERGQHATGRYSASGAVALVAGTVADVGGQSEVVVVASAVGSVTGVRHTTTTHCSLVTWKIRITSTLFYINVRLLHCSASFSVLSSVTALGSH